MISIAVLTKKGSREMNEDSLAYKQQGEEALLALADATDALRFESAAFAEWTEKINRMQEAAEAVLAYLKGDD